MKRVLEQTTPWVVVPVTVLGASLLFALAHTVLDSGTPPAARHQPLTTLDRPSPQPLPRMESEGAVLPSAPDVLTTRDGVDSRQRLASSDAVSVLDPANFPGRVNTEWHPMNSQGAIPARPVALVSTAGYVPQARMVAPAPRYGSNVSDWDEMPLVAPAEEVHEPVESPQLGLVNSMFAPPGLAPSPAQAEPALADASETPPVEETWEPLPPLLEPLPPMEVSEVDPVAPELDMAEPLLPLPPVEMAQPDQDALATVEANELLAVTTPETLEGTFLPLPPVEPAEVDPFVLPHPEIVDAPSEPIVDTTVDVVMPLPPVDSVLAETVVDEIEPALIPLPPVEPRLLETGDSLALAMVEGLFKRIEAEPEPTPDEQTDAIGESPSDQLDAQDASEMQVAVDGDVQLPQPLPPVVRNSEDPGTEASANTDESLAFRQYDRSWELELIAREADKHSHRGFELANKKAYFSARLEFTRALRIMAQGLDTEFQTRRHSQALAAGLRALTEAEDFLPKDGHLEAELDLDVIAGAHRTPVLRECDASELTPLAAIQKYHVFAQEKMADAVGREVAGSMALAGLGKLHVTIANQQRGDGIASARPKAMVLLQAALIASPANHMAANELGVLLARNSRHAEARRAFEYSIAACPTAEAWRNLALTCEQLGEMDAAYEAAQQTLALRGKSNDGASITPSRHGTIRWIPPAEFSNGGRNLRTASASGTSDRTR